MLTAVASGFILAILVALVRRISSPAAGWFLAALPACLAAYFSSQASRVWRGGPILEHHTWAPGMGVALDFRLDGLSLLFALLITVIGAFVLVYSGKYLRDRARLGRLYGLLLFFMASMLGLVLAGNLLLLYVFWELTSISSYLLIGFENQRAAARSAALQALLVTVLGGLCLLAGIVLLGNIGGSFEITALLAQGDAIRAHALYPAALSRILIAAFTKSAQLPFHFWLPKAMEAPTPVSAYLHAATMVKAGVYLLARLNPALGGTTAWTAALVAVGVVTMVGGAVLALNKTDLKQILAYSTVSVLGMLVFLIGLGTPLAFQAMAVYLVAHGLYKGALFLVAGAVEHETGTRDIGKLGALFKSMPVTASASVLAALSMAGLPPMLGFTGKELLYESALHAPVHAGLLTTAAVAAGALLFILAAAAGFGPFFGGGRHSGADVHEAPSALWIGPLVLATGGLVLGLAPALMNAAVRSATLAVAPAAATPVDLALFHGLSPALVLSAVSAGGGLALYSLHGRLIVAGDGLKPLAQWGPASIYDRAVGALNRIAVTQTGLLQTGYLRHYMQMVIVTTVALVIAGIVRWAALPQMVGPVGPQFHEAVLAVAIIIATIFAVRSTSRLAAVAALGVVGIGVSLIFALFGAPDLAMTQLTVESLIVILLVLVMYHLPDFGVFGPRRYRLRNLIVSAAGGITMTLLVLTAASVQYAPPISTYYVENSYTQAHGRNIVNVIITDFRALDTLGETTVVAASAAGVWAILRLRSRKGFFK
ncbi:MAG TPA: putative monovalent cation/H+ antiporter subunit A [Bryobacteraceae bacterium]|nr:putative monovalent cation/H+ antiporter subunit A [Bryobacteraceae bacterium]